MDRFKTNTHYVVDLGQDVFVFIPVTTPDWVMEIIYSTCAETGQEFPPRLFELIKSFKETINGLEHKANSV